MKRLRVTAKLSQADMGRRMGFTLRGYQDLEHGRTPFSPRHAASVERLSLALAIERACPTLVLEGIGRDALYVAALSQT